MHPRRREPMHNVLFELRMHNAHQNNLVSGRIHPVDQDEETKPAPRTYSLVWQEMPWADGYGVRDDATGVIITKEPFRTERLAQEYINELEGEE